MTLEERAAELEKTIGALKGAIVAFSGGADSAYLAYVSHQVLGASAIAVTADSPSLPRRELREAEALADERGWRHEIVATIELEDERYASNPVDRCYYCKTALMDVLAPMASEKGWAVLLGTNVDDLSDHRPGQRAAVEAGALQPMVDAGLTKSDVRRLSARFGLPTADKPAAACLASRFAYGVRVSAAGLGRIEEAEEALSRLGFPTVRVRDLGDDNARVEVGADQLHRIGNEADAIVAAVRSHGFREVQIDPKGYRRGAMNESVTLLELSRSARSG